MSTSTEQVRRLATPLRADADLDPLLERVGDARFVLAGVASHGSHEFYAWPAAAARRLITEADFDLVVLGRRYDAFCWIEQTTALQPLPGTSAPGEDERWPYGQ
jgi:erythromycin esterase-like protein